MRESRDWFLHLSAPAFCQILVDGNRLTVGGGAALSHFVSTAVREGLSGPEQMVGVPGTVGGALHANVSAHGVDIGSWVESAQVLTRSGEVITRDADSLTFSYGKSSLTELVILSAVFEFEQEDSALLTRRMQKLWIVRRASQPLSERNAAYFFKDHGGQRASDLIDKAGLKGTQVGKAEVSDRDANVIVAHTGATAQDVMRLMDLVKSQVHERFDVELETVGPKSGRRQPYPILPNSAIGLRFKDSVQR